MYSSTFVISFTRLFLWMHELDSLMVKDSVWINRFPMATSFFSVARKDAHQVKNLSVLTAILTNMGKKSPSRSGRIMLEERLKLVAKLATMFSVDKVISFDSCRAFERFVKNSHELRSKFL